MWRAKSCCMSIHPAQSSHLPFNSWEKEVLSYTEVPTVILKGVILVMPLWLFRQASCDWVIIWFVACIKTEFAVSDHKGCRLIWELCVHALTQCNSHFSPQLHLFFLLPSSGLTSADPFTACCKATFFWKDCTIFLKRWHFLKFFLTYIEKPHCFILSGLFQFWSQFLFSFRGDLVLNNLIYLKVFLKNSGYDWEEITTGGVPWVLNITHQQPTTSPKHRHALVFTRRNPLITWGKVSSNCSHLKKVETPAAEEI